MFEYAITSKKLAQALNISETAMSHLKNSELLPKLGSSKICKIARCLSAISGSAIEAKDLIEFVSESTN